jgi:hypothetical protein
MKKPSKPFVSAAIIGAALFLATARTYYLWFVILFTEKGFSNRWIFVAAERFLFATLVIGIITYALTRVQLPIPWHRVYLALLALGIGLFVVDWMIQLCGVGPSWHRS